MYYEFEETADNTFSYALAEKRKRELKMSRTRMVKTLPLQTILDKYNMTHIDFVDINVEGFEIQVIRTIDFNKTDIDVLLVEQLGSNLEDVVRSDIARYLKQFNYSAISKFNRTVIYEKQCKY